MDQDDKVCLGREDTLSVNLEEQIDKDVVCRRFCSAHTASTLPENSGQLADNLKYSCYWTSNNLHS